MGIYKITNKVNGKFYLGSSKDIDKRWYDHKRDLRNNKHHSIHLQRAFTKYGEGSFLFEIIEIVCDKNKLLPIEQGYLDTLKPWDRMIGYNMSKNASGCCLSGKEHPYFGKKFSEITKQKMKDYALNRPKEHANKIAEAHRGMKRSNESKLKMSECQMGKKLTEEHRKKLSKQVVQLSKKGVYINTFDSISQAYKITKSDMSSIIRCCKGRQLLAKGYKWMYAKDYYQQIAI